MIVVRFLLSRWSLSFVGVAILSALVWFFGPLLETLEGWIPRLAIALVLLAIWAATNLLLDLRRRRRERTLEEGVTEGMAAAARADESASEEVAALSERLSTALALLKKARGTRGYLYEQPWYAIIGPPGAGKTTALLNAGLKFPLAAEMGQGAVAGVGGTRLCDWWFTENAVLIDTAGRYTTQDSNATVDRAGWDAFLGLLRRTRPRQPLNGVIVAIALSDIADAPADERLAHARAIRRRIKELEERLGIRMPVYALFTKADLISGFTEFFDDLDRERRNQVWGVTFPLSKAEAGPVEGFPEELRLLVERLNERLFDRLQAEHSPDRRALIAGFPTQVATLAQPLQTFLVEAFGGSRLDPAPLLRGAYFTSGTQEGSPIDRLTGAMARAFGVDQRRAASLRPERGRSYFLGRLVSEVIFGEAMLVSEPPGARARRLALRGGAFAAVILASLGLAGWLVVSESRGQRDIDAMAKALAAYETTAKGQTLDPVNDADLPRLLPLLDGAHNLAATQTGSEGVLASFGLSQAAKLRTGAAATYRHALGHALLPRLIWRLEAQMRGNFTQPDFLYEATRVYLMLGGQGPLDRALVKEWMTFDWQATYAGAFNAEGSASIWTRCWRTRCPRCRWMMPWLRRRARHSAGFPWQAGSIPGSSHPPRRNACRLGSPARRWDRRA
jgi:type VI secretion system protein ImpL